MLARPVLRTVAVLPSLRPSLPVNGVKGGSNPTFNFDSIVESVVKVGATYYCVYQGNWLGTWDVRLAMASAITGPWTAAGSIYTITNVPWKAASTLIYAPSLTFDGSTFYLYYSLVKGTGAVDAGNGIGLATASTITGPYTDHGSAILSPGAGAAWDSRRVGEQDVIRVGSTWVMAYMGESSAAAYQASEKIGIATASTPEGPWTKAGANPVIDFGASGQWDDALIADPCLIHTGGRYWIMYAGAPDSGPSTVAHQGLAYSVDPTSAFTRHPSNPILSAGAGGDWDDVWAFRGALYEEDGTWHGVYAGYDGANMKGGNFTLVFG